MSFLTSTLPSTLVMIELPRMDRVALLQYVMRLLVALVGLDPSKDLSMIEVYGLEKHLSE